MSLPRDKNKVGKVSCSPSMNSNAMPFWAKNIKFIKVAEFYNLQNNTVVPCFTNGIYSRNYLCYRVQNFDFVVDLSGEEMAKL